jgi:hypothetical protein
MQPEVFIMLNKFDVIKKILDDQNTLGARADTKAVAFLSSLGLFTVFFIYFVKDITINYLTIAVMVIYIISALLAIYNIIMTLYPRMRTSGKEGAVNSPDPNKAAFFADICRFNTLADYISCLQEMLKDEETVAAVYARQIYEVSALTASKYKYANRAAYFVMITIGAEFALIAYVFASKALG